MNCCVNCFLDLEIKDIIRGQNIIGDCNFCGSVNVNIYNTNDRERILSDLIYELVSIYVASDSLPTNFPNNKKDLLKNILHNDWHIFNLEPEAIQNLLRTICDDKYSEYQELFDSLVGLPQICDQEYLETNSLLKGNSWDNFVTAIKTENRFHLNYINTNILGLFVDYAKTSYKAGERFYRARISTSPNGFSIDEMGAPQQRLQKLAGLMQKE